MRDTSDEDQYSISGRMTGETAPYLIGMVAVLVLIFLIRAFFQT